MLKKTAILLAFVILWFRAACAIEFIPLGRAEVLNTYSGVKNGGNLLGYDLNGYFSPVIKFNNNFYLIPLYSGQYIKIRQFLPEDEGNHLSNAYFTHNLTVALRYEYAPGWFVKFGPLGTWNFMRENSDEDWGRGLYDYRDAGFSLGLRHKISTEEKKEDYSAGLEYYRRQYPNFTTLISAATVTPPERREKDFDAYKTTLGFEKTFPSGLQCYLKPYYLFKYFIDKHLCRDDGTLNLDLHRKDSQLSLDAGFKSALSDIFTLYWDNNYSFNYSNQGYYDTRNTVALTDDVFIAHYYGYHRYSLGPSIGYLYSIDQGKDVILKLGYSFVDRYYTDRLKQSDTGAYSDKLQRDIEHVLSSTFSFPLTRKLDFLAKFSYTWERSNQKFQQYYKYNYDVYQVEAGLAFDF